jgi:threonine/homoserine/homoserine lactone efflux protein
MFADYVPVLSVLAAYAVAAAVLGLTPGPDMTFFLSKTVAQSRSAGLVAFGGATTGLVIHSLAIAAGLSVLLAASVTAFTILKVLGALYLAYLAIDAVRNGSALSLDRAGRIESLRSVYLKGLLVNLLNPKIIVFFVTFLPQFVSASDPHAAGKLAFLGLFFIVVALPLTTAMVLAADWFSGLLRRNPRAARAIDYVFAGVFGTFAVKILTTR